MSELNNIIEWIKAYFDEKAKKNIKFAQFLMVFC